MPVATNSTCSAPLASRVHFGFACLLYALHGFFAWFPRMPHMPSSNRFLACFASHAFASAKPKGVFFNCHFCLDICTFFTTIKWSHFMVHFWLKEFILESLWESSGDCPDRRWLMVTASVGESNGGERSRIIMSINFVRPLSFANKLSLEQIKCNGVACNWREALRWIWYPH